MTSNRVIVLVVLCVLALDRPADGTYLTQPSCVEISGQSVRSQPMPHLDQSEYSGEAPASPSCPYHVTGGM
jgi:hypothetical protein